MTAPHGIPSPLLAGDPALLPSGDLALARTIVGSYPDDDPAALGHRDTILGFIDAHPDVLHRSCVEGHLTGSALVVDPRTERMLMLFHAKLQRWLQPGGHADGDANLASVALREATEETGIAGLRVHPTPIDLDVHRVGGGKDPDHDHLDVRFLVLAPADAEVVINHESEGARWVSFAELAGLDPDPGTVRMARTGLSLLRVG